MKKGFTLIELLVVMGIFTLFLSGGLFLSISSFNGYYFRAEEDLIGNLLRGARSRAISNINHTSHGVFISDQYFILFQGGNYEENSPTNEDFPRNKSIQVDSTLPNQTIVFENLSGSPSQTGEIRLFDEQRESVITINPEGAM